MKRTGIGDAPRSRPLTVNDITYLIVTQPDQAGRQIWRVADGGDRLVGEVFRESASCWGSGLKDKCWKSIEQAAVEVAMADQGVDYAR